MIQKPGKNEGQRLDRYDLIIELHDLDESYGLGIRDQRPRAHSAREFVKAHAFLSEAFGNLDGGKLCKCAERMDPPAIQRFQNFRRR